MLHGGPGFPHDYLLSLKAIAKTRPVYFYDQLGCGHSTLADSQNSKQYWTVKYFSQELNTLVTQLHLNRFDLLGQSWGGTLAIEYTLHHQDKIDHLILASPFISAKLWEKDSQRLIAKLPLKEKAMLSNPQANVDSKEYKEAMQLYYKKHIYLHMPYPKMILDSLTGMNNETYQTMWGNNEFTLTGNLSSFEKLHDLTKIKIPTLITCGRYDEATPETMKLALKKLPHGQLQIFENSGHMAHIEEKDKYISTVEKFLGKN